MTPEIITGLFLGLAALIAAISAAIVQLVTLKRGQQQQTYEIQKVHVLVNSRLSAVVDRVEQLTQELVNADVEVPPDPAEPNQPFTEGP